MPCSTTVIIREQKTTGLSQGQTSGTLDVADNSGRESLRPPLGGDRDHDTTPLGRIVTVIAVAANLPPADLAQFGIDLTISNLTHNIYLHKE